VDRQAATVASRSKGGSDLPGGRPADRWFNLVFGCLIAVPALTEILRGTRHLAPFAILAMGIGFFALGGTRRFQLRETGVWNAGRLIPWGKIEGYRIGAMGSLMLKMQDKKPKFVCVVPAAIRLQAEDLLASKCPSLQAAD